MQKRTLQNIARDATTPKTQLVMVTGFLVLGWLFSQIIFVYAAGFIGIASFIPAVGNRLVWLWFKLAEWLGWFNSHVLLSLIYYVLVTPIGFLFRLTGNDPLFLKDKKGSMYTFREHTFVKEDMENPW